MFVQNLDQNERKYASWGSHAVACLGNGESMSILTRVKPKKCLCTFVVTRDGVGPGTVEKEVRKKSHGFALSNLYPVIDSMTSKSAKQPYRHQLASRLALMGLENNALNHNQYFFHYIYIISIYLRHFSQKLMECLDGRLFHHLCQHGDIQVWHRMSVFF